MSNVRQTIIAFADQVLQHFPPFRWDEEQEKAWADTLVRELGGFSTEVIDRAGREIVRNRKKPQTPLVSECIDACRNARKLVESISRASLLPVDGAGQTSNMDWTSDRMKLAWELIVGPLGKQAAKEQWVKSLWNFCRRNSRLPQPNEIEGCKREHREFMEAYRQCSIGPNPRVRQWLSMGDEMLKRQKEMADYVLNGVVK